MKTKLQKYISVTLVVALLLSVCAIGLPANAAEFAGYTPISTKEDLYNIRNNTTKKYYLTNDIVFNSSDSNWTPIESFSGILNGNNYSIKGLKIDSSAFANETSVGLINKQYGTILNLTMDGCKITYHTTQYSTTAETAVLCIGTIAGTNYGTIKNCHNSSEVSATSKYVASCVYAGGIAGRNYEGTITGCRNSGKIFSSHYLGGIVGYAFCSLINNCTNSASLFTDYEFACAGGMVGYSNSSTIENCCNSGEVMAYYPVETGDPFTGYDFSNSAGGIVGEMIDYEKYNRDSIILNCYNTAAISGTWAAGGIVGHTSGGRIEKCFNTGAIICDHASGGITGNGYENFISDCFNVATVFVTTDYAPFAKAGGITGCSDYGSIKNCYNIGYICATGTASSETDVGAISGYNVQNPIKNCYYSNMFNDKGVDYGSDKATAINLYFSLAQESSYAGFDFNNTWEIDYSTGYSFPILRSINYDHLALDWQYSLTDKRIPSDPPSYSGVCGDNLTWAIYPTGFLYIFGTGDMYDYSKSNPAPWSKYYFETAVAVTNGITSVGDYAFYNCDKLAIAMLGYDVERIGESAFEGCDTLINTIVHENLRLVEKNAFADCPKYMITEYIGQAAQAITMNVEEGNNSFLAMAYTKSDLYKTVDLINKPSKTALNYGEVLWLTIDESKLPEGTKIFWYNGNNYGFSLYERDGNSLAVQALQKTSGKAIIYAVVVDENSETVKDENGNIMIDYIEIDEKYSFFMLIIHWFRSLFDIVKIYT